MRKIYFVVLVATLILSVATLVTAQSGSGGSSNETEPDNETETTTTTALGETTTSGETESPSGTTTAADDGTATAAGQQTEAPGAPTNTEAPKGGETAVPPTVQTPPPAPPPAPSAGQTPAPTQSPAAVAPPPSPPALGTTKSGSTAAPTQAPGTAVINTAIQLTLAPATKREEVRKKLAAVLNVAESDLMISDGEASDQIKITFASPNTAENEKLQQKALALPVDEYKAMGASEPVAAKADSAPTPAPAAELNLPLIIGGVAGGLVVLGLIIYVISKKAAGGATGAAFADAAGEAPFSSGGYLNQYERQMTAPPARAAAQL